MYFQSLRGKRKFYLFTNRQYPVSFTLSAYKTYSRTYCCLSSTLEVSLANAFLLLVVACCIFTVSCGTGELCPVVGRITEMEPWLFEPLILLPFLDMFCVISGLFGWKTAEISSPETCQLVCLHSVSTVNRSGFLVRSKMQTPEILYIKYLFKNNFTSKLITKVI